MEIRPKCEAPMIDGFAGAAFHTDSHACHAWEITLNADGSESSAAKHRPASSMIEFRVPYLGFMVSHKSGTLSSIRLSAFAYAFDL